MKNKIIVGLICLFSISTALAGRTVAATASDPCRAAGIRKIMAKARAELSEVDFVDGYYDDEDSANGPTVDVEVKGTDKTGKSCEHFYTVAMTGKAGAQCTAGHVESGGCDD